MRITHYGHACVLVETNAARLLFDPGTFSTGFEQVSRLDAVLLTHQHPDHVDVERLPALLRANPEARLIADAHTAESLADQHVLPSSGPQVETASAGPESAGTELTIGDSTIRTVGGSHAVIHPDIPVIDNLGYVLNDGAFYHPGDSFHVPEQRIDVLGLPTGAPWLKLSEAVDFFRAVAPRVAVPIHEAVLSVPDMHYRMFNQLGPAQSQVTVLEPGIASEV